MSSTIVILLIIAALIAKLGYVYFISLGPSNGVTPEGVIIV